MSYKVQLINKDLGKSCLFGRVQGFSGKTYATSRYQPCGHHVAELTAEEYERAVEDISRGWQRPLCRWIPMFVEVATEHAAGEGEDGTYRANGSNEADDSASRRKELARLPMEALRRKAKVAGVVLKGILRKKEIIEAMLAGGGAAKLV